MSEGALLSMLEVQMFNAQVLFFGIGIHFGKRDPDPLPKKTFVLKWPSFCTFHDRFSIIVATPFLNSAVQVRESGSPSSSHSLNGGMGQGALSWSLAWGSR